MLKFLIDNIFVKFGGCVFQRGDCVDRIYAIEFEILHCISFFNCWLLIVLAVSSNFC